MIYELRGVQVMLDSDLAKLYECTNGTKSINLAVKRHINRFPESYMFQLTKEEASRFQIETLNKNDNYRGSNVKYLPYAFTEEGVSMLSAVLHTPVAEEISIKIMDVFVAMRHFIGNNLLEQRNINNMVLKHDNELYNHANKIKELQDTFNKFIKPEENNKVFFDGQIYDAYSLLLDLFDKAKEEIIIIDNYSDKKLLDLLSKTNKKIKVYSKNMDCELINKYNKQYDNVEIINNDLFHDRFIILDRKILYNVGASFKDLGKKCFSINKIEDKNIIKSILNKLELI